MNLTFDDLLQNPYTYAIGSSQITSGKNDSAFVLDVMRDAIYHCFFDEDFSLNYLDSSQSKEYIRVFEKDVVKRLLRSPDKLVSTLFELTSQVRFGNPVVGIKLSRSQCQNFIDKFFSGNSRLSASIKASYAQYRGV